MKDPALFPDLEKIEFLIKKSTVCRLGINTDKTPYIVPLSFGYHAHTLYFHSGSKGKKLELLKENPDVCFEFDLVTEVMKAENPCAWDIKYESIIGIGKAVFIEDAGEKIEALKMIISQYTDRQMNIAQTQAKETVVFKVIIDKMTFRQNPA